MNNPNRFPSRQQLSQILQEGGDPLSYAIRGHQAVESILTAAISEALPAPHEIEITRLSFPLKVDLAVALRILRSEVKPTLLAVNAVRNRFAHNRDYSFGQNAAQDLKNTICAAGLGFEEAFQKLDDPQMILRHAIALTYFIARAALERVQETKIENQVAMEMADETLRGEIGGGPSTVESEFRERVARKKQERNT